MGYTWSSHIRRAGSHLQRSVAWHTPLSWRGCASSWLTVLQTWSATVCCLWAAISCTFSHLHKKRVSGMEWSVLFSTFVGCILYFYENLKHHVWMLSAAIALLCVFFSFLTFGLFKGAKRDVSCGLQKEQNNELKCLGREKYWWCTHDGLDMKTNGKGSYVQNIELLVLFLFVSDFIVFVGSDFPLLLSSGTFSSYLKVAETKWLNCQSVHCLAPCLHCPFTCLEFYIRGTRGVTK